MGFASVILRLMPIGFAEVDDCSVRSANDFAGSLKPSNLPLFIITNKKIMFNQNNISHEKSIHIDDGFVYHSIVRPIRSY